MGYQVDNPQEDFAAKLNRLFEERMKPDGSRYTQAEVVEASNGALTRVSLWRLRTGQAANPSYQTVQALARVFGVTPGYFFEEGKKNASESYKVQKRDALVDKIAMRSAQLDEDGKQAVLYMIESITKSRRRK